jgi:hypothetical protein
VGSAPKGSPRKRLQNGECAKTRVFHSNANLWPGDRPPFTHSPVVLYRLPSSPVGIMPRLEAGL